MLSSPLRIFEYFPRTPISNPFEDGINPMTFIERVRRNKTKDISRLTYNLEVPKR